MSEREVVYKRGASFFKDGDTVYFRFQSDGSSVVIEKAKDRHKEEYAGEWEDYLKSAFNGAPLETFDHDNDGNPGGSTSTVYDEEGNVLYEPPIRPVSDEHKHEPPAPRRGRPRKKV